MAEIGGATGSISLNVTNQSSKAEELMNIMTGVANKIYEIDGEITALVNAGFEGSAVQTMSKTYLKNREVINDFVKRFATVAVVLDENAAANKAINAQAESNASGAN